MMSFEDFLVRAGVMEESFLEVKEARKIERIYVYDNSPMVGTGMPVGVNFGVPSPVGGMGVSAGVNVGGPFPGVGMGMGVGVGVDVDVDVKGLSPVVGKGVPVGMDVGGSRNSYGRGGEKKSPSSLEPLNRTEHRVIKKREVAARARARMQARILGLELRKKSLEEENDQILKEKEQIEKERLKQLMDKVIPVVEKQRSPRVLRRVRSMEW